MKEPQTAQHTEPSSGFEIMRTSGETVIMVTNLAWPERCVFETAVSKQFLMSARN